MTMKIDLDAIERVALAASRGSLRVSEYDRTIRREDGVIVARYPHRTGDSPVTHSEWIADAHHIANCSPDVVLALVARIRELEQKLEPSRLQELLEMRLLDASEFPYAASKESIAEVVEAIVL